MTALRELFAGSDTEPEGATLTQPPRRSARPFWTGIPGLDPGVPAPADRELAARIAAEACAVHVHGMTATLGLIMRKSPAEKYLAWLLDAGDDLEAWVRRYALRVTCDRVQDAEPGDVLDAAWQTVAFIYPGRRR